MLSFQKYLLWYMNTYVHSKHVHLCIGQTCTPMYRATLDTYSKRVRGQMRSQYAAVYPVMVSLLKRGLETGEEGEGEGAGERTG